MFEKELVKSWLRASTNIEYSPEHTKCYESLKRKQKVFKKRKNVWRV